MKLKNFSKKEWIIFSFLILVLVASWWVIEVKAQAVDITNDFNFGATGGSGGKRIQNLPNPSDPWDAAPKNYVDTHDFQKIEGGIHYSAGNVGIGTTVPGYSLEVNGSINIKDGDTNYYRYGGAKALKLLKDASNVYTNTIVGSAAGNDSITQAGPVASNQTVVGYMAGNSTTDNSDYQTAVGYMAGRGNSGESQTAVGQEAGYSNSGANQIAIGYQAGYGNNKESQTAVGYQAGYSNTGIDQTAVGLDAGYYNIGTHQVAIGTLAGSRNQENFQTALGYSAGYQNEGVSQTVLGYLAGFQNYGDHQVAIGWEAGRSNIGMSQTAIGFQAGHDNTGVSQAVLGYNAGYGNIGDFQTAVGQEAGYGNKGINQTALGYQAGYRNSDGDPNEGVYQTAIGYRAGYMNRGFNQTTLGDEAGYENTGNYQTALGHMTGYGNRGLAQVAIGNRAGYMNTGNYQITIGYGAGYENTGSKQTALGYGAGTYNSGTTQTALGYLAGALNRKDWQVALGYQAGQYNEGTENVAIGSQAFNDFKLDLPRKVFFDAENIDDYTDTITILNGHGFNPGEYINLKYTEGTEPIEGLEDGAIYRFYVVSTTGLKLDSANLYHYDNLGTINNYAQEIRSAGAGLEAGIVDPPPQGQDYILTPQYVYSNSVALGYNAEPDKSNQVVLGNEATVEVKTAGYIYSTSGEENYFAGDINTNSNVRARGNINTEGEENYFAGNINTDGNVRARGNISTEGNITTGTSGTGGKLIIIDENGREWEIYIASEEQKVILKNPINSNYYSFNLTLEGSGGGIY